MLVGLEQIGKQIGPRTLFQGVNLQIRTGDRIGLVGPNGAGKTTLLRLIAGDEPCDGGRVSYSRGVRVGMLRQEIDPRLERSVRAEASSALAHLDDLERELRALETQMGSGGGEVDSTLAERYDRAHGAFEHGGGFQREARVESVLAGLGFAEDARGRALSSFSGGWLMRVELAKLLLSDPDVLLLDEPTNHLDLPAIQWFEATLEAFRGGVVVVSHDRAFLRSHANRIAELDGASRFVSYDGGYDAYLQNAAERREQLAARKSQQDREIAHMERFVERFRAKATKAKQAQSRIKALDKIERIELEPAAKRRMRLKIPAPPRSGEVVMTLSDIHKSYGDTRVYAGVGIEVRRNDRLALVGPNGAGKSTLLRILGGSLDFDRGERLPGHNVKVAFYAQHQLEVLEGSRSVLEEMSDGVRTDDLPRLRGHLGAFLFSGDDVEKKVSVLSGGEKARLALAKMLLRPANLLVLDEPTNHLDIVSCEVLEEALAAYQGTLVLISHDRDFINRLANRVIEVQGGALREFLGNYDDYLRKIGETQSATDVPSSNSTRDLAAAGSDAAKPVSAREDRERRKARDRVKRRIERLEEEILEHEGNLEKVGWRLGDPAVYRDAEQRLAIESQRDELRATIGERYGEWERLADELAALEDAPADGPRFIDAKPTAP